MKPEDLEKLDPRIVLAMLNFGLLFSQYVDEIDHEIWERAVDYAKSFTTMDGIDIQY